MNKTIFITLLAFCLLSTLKGYSQGTDMQAYMTHGQFYAPEIGPYIETNLAVNASNLVYQKTDNGKFQSKLEVTKVFKQNDTVVSYRKYNLFSPEIDDTSDISFNFIDQQRFPLDTGAYDFNLRILDAYADTTSLKYEMPVFVQFEEDQLEISTIQLVESYQKAEDKSNFSKNGMDIIPYVSEFFPEDINTLTFYTEIYNMEKLLDEGEGFLVKYYLESYESNSIMHKYSGFKRMNAKPVNMFFHKFDIKGLPSGNYNIVVDIRDKENENIGTKKKFFQRSNPGVSYDIANIEAMNISETFTEQMSRDSLLHYIPALDPITNHSDKLFIRSDLEKKETETLQKFFLNFWTSRDPDDPEKAWIEYCKNVREVEKFYGTKISRGYQTDRGRVYLQYGPPNTISSRDHEPSSYPYEIWHYHKLGKNQWNKKFVFYNPDLITNDYELIHSNAIGETYNQTWKFQINKRNSITNDPYDTRNPDHWGSEAEDLYNNPY
ncbi:MAG: GWxTD domain-containing protein [Bacteroidales bacterium]